MTEFDPAMIEAMASEIGSDEDWFDAAVRVLRALPISAAALNALEAGEAVVVPMTLTAAMSAKMERVWSTESRWNAALAASPYQEKKDG